jgi:hypothetical protein
MQIDYSYKWLAPRNSHKMLLIVSVYVEIVGGSSEGLRPHSESDLAVELVVCRKGGFRLSRDLYDVHSMPG